MSFKSNYSVSERFRHVILAIVSGAVLALAMPKPGIWLTSWVGLVPLFIAIRGARPGRAAAAGMIAGLVYYGIILQYVGLFGYLPFVLLVVYQAVYFAVFAVLCLRLSPARIGLWGYAAIPAAWVVVQYVRTLGMYAFTWGAFSHTQANNLVVAQIGSITGPWGIDFLVCFVNLALASALASNGERRVKPLVIAASLVVAASLFGVFSMRSVPPTERTARVAVIQGNMVNHFHPVPNYLTKAYQTYTRLSVQASKARPDLIVWPETTLPTDITSPGAADFIGATAKQVHTTVLAGGYDPSDDITVYGSYNALFMFDKLGKQVGAYHKVRLVPFGEFVPLRDQLPFLANYGIRAEDVVAARRHALLDSPIGKIGVSICFESVFPQVARVETRDGAVLLVVVTNDAWLGKTQAGRQHMMMAKLRAIENGRYVLRAASTGISTVIDPCGRTRREIGLYRQGTIAETVACASRVTLYTRLGDWFAYACVALTLACLAVPNPALPKKSSRAKRRRGI